MDRFFAKFSYYFFREVFAFHVSRKFRIFSRNSKKRNFSKIFAFFASQRNAKKMRNFRRIFFAKRFSIFVGNPRPDKFDFLMLVHKIILEERRGQKFLPVMSHNFTICCCLVCILKIQRVEILCRKPRI